LDARGSFDPHNTNSALTYAWDFGDGTKASGATASHTYAAKGTYPLTVMVSSATGVQRIQKTVTVLAETVVYNNPYKQYQADGNPRPNPDVVLPKPNDTLADKVLNSPVTASLPPVTSTPPLPVASPRGMLLGPVIISIGTLIVVVVLGAGLLMLQRRRNTKL